MQADAAASKPMARAPHAPTCGEEPAVGAGSHAEELGAGHIQLRPHVQAGGAGQGAVGAAAPQLHPAVQATARQAGSQASGCKKV